MTSYLRRNLVFYETTTIISGMRGTTEPTVSYFYLDFNLILQEITDMATKKTSNNIMFFVDDTNSVGSEKN